MSSKTNGWVSLLSFFLLLLSSGGYPADANGDDVPAPRFIQEPPPSVLFSNSTGTSIPCVGPGPSARWVLSADGQPLRDVPGLRAQRQDGALVFSPFAPHQYRADVHAAVYRCVVEGNAGVVESRDVRVTAVLEHPFELQVLDQLVLKGGCALLHCPLPTYVSDYVTITHWEREDGLLVRSDDPPNGKYVVVSNGDLFVRDVTELDSAHGFRCHVASRVSQRKYASDNFARLIVAAPQQNQPSRITFPRPGTSVSVPIGTRAALGCCAQGWPTPALRWRGGRRAFSTHGGLMVVEGVTPQDGGTYSCFASNAMGEDRMDVELIVNEEVSVSVFPTIVRMSPGRETILNCSLSGPGVGVQWRRGGRPLPLPPPHPRVLRLAPPAGQGPYQCFAITADGALAAQSAAMVIIADVAPHFTATFPSQTILPGESTTLRCSASGNPPPRITWSLDGRPTGGHEPRPTLTLDRVSVGDSGLYACHGVNAAGAVRYAARINVRGKPFVRKMGNKTALAGMRVDVECPYGGWPVDAVAWKKDDRLLPMHQRQRVHPNGTLTISELQAGADDGLYSCHVTSPGSDTAASQAFHLSVKTAPKVSEFSFRDDLSSGERTAVTCVVRAGDAPVVTRWLRDGLPVSPGPALVITGSAFVTTLSFEALDRSHAGNYTCVADNEAGTDSYSAVLTVRVPPRWLLEPTDSWAVSGRPARMDCQADGVPQPHVRWKMAAGGSGDYQTIVSSSQVHILVNGSLNFRAVSPSDAGAYLCEAANGLGAPLSALVRLRVHSPPKFASKFTSLTARRGEKVTLTCRPEGDHPVTFAWRKNGVPIDPIAKPRYSQKSTPDSGASLVVERAEREDSASFTCTASNDFGQDDTSFQLTVQDVPDAPQNLEIHDIGSRTVRLTWDRPFDGNSPILKYSAQWRKANGGESSAVGGPSGEERSLVVRGLRPRTRYLFRVRAENALGTSQFGAEVAADTLQEPPRDPPIAVRAVAVSSRAINVTWQRASSTDEEDPVEGFYVGFRTAAGSESFTFRSVPLEAPQSVVGRLALQVQGLRRDTEYAFLVQPYNARGAGPPSQEVRASTKQFDSPSTPSIKSYYTTSQSIKLSWEVNITPDAPVSGFRVYVRAEGGEWREWRLRGEAREHVVRDLQCGTRHQCYLQAFNAAATSPDSQPMHIKTDGGPPIAPDKRQLLWSNASCAQLRLHSWGDGGCPIRSFAAKFRPSSRPEWTLVSNHLVPQQREVLVPDLAPGQWWTLLLTARNDAGHTDAEYLFATLTLRGELPPRPSEAGEGLLQRHLLVGVPVASATLVLLAVLCVVCVLARRRADRSVLSQQGGASESCVDSSKGESLALHSTFEGGGGGESTYFPAPHRTFAYTYDVPYPNKQMEKSEPNYESPILYFPGYTKDLSHRQRLSSYGRNRKTKNGLSWRRDEASGGSSDSEGESRPVRREDRLTKEECRESETECDRIWKSLEECKYEANQRWAEHAVSILS